MVTFYFLYMSSFFSDEQCYETDLKPHFVFTYLVTRAAKDIINKSRVEVSLVEQDTVEYVSWPF